MTLIINYTDNIGREWTQKGALASEFLLSKINERKVKLLLAGGLVLFFALQFCGLNSVEVSFYKMQHLEGRLSENPNDEDAVNDFFEYSQSKNSIIRSNALAFLGRCSRANAGLRSKVIPILRKGLKDEDRYVRKTSAAQIKDLGYDGLPAMYELIHLLKDENSLLAAVFAAEALGNFGRDAEPAVPALIESLKEGTSTDYLQLRIYAAEALGKIGPNAKAAIPALRKAANDSDRAFAAAAEAAIKKVEAD